MSLFHCHHFPISRLRVGLIQALGSLMKYLAVIGFFVALAPVPAQAVCLIEPLEPQLRAADIIYVGTVVRSELSPSLEALRAAKDPRKGRAEVSHTLIPEFILKGAPPQAPVVLSTWQYNDPRSKVSWDLAERSTLMPGDTLLVVAKSGEPARYGLCTATREWNSETAKVAYAVFPPAP